MFIQVITGATGIVTNGLRKNFEILPGKNSVDSIQKTAKLGTAHIILEVLQSETDSLCGGDRRWFRRIIGKERPVTRDNLLTHSMQQSPS